MKKEIPFPQPFRDLSLTDKVLAMLATMYDDVAAKSLVLRWAGIDYENLDEEDKRQIDSAFDSDMVVCVEAKFGEAYMITDEGRASIIKRVNMGTVVDASFENINKSNWDRLLGDPE